MELTYICVGIATAAAGIGIYEYTNRSRGPVLPRGAEIDVTPVAQSKDLKCGPGTRCSVYEWCSTCQDIPQADELADTQPEGGRRMPLGIGDSIAITVLCTLAILAIVPV